MVVARQRRIVIPAESSSIAATVRTAANAAERRVLALLDELEVLLPVLSDELVVWIVTLVRDRGAGRPHDPRDPWSVLLRCMAPDARPGVNRLRKVVSLSWGFLAGARGLTARPTAGQYAITLQATLGRAARRAVLGHELAHVDLDNLTAAALPWWSNVERLTDEHACRLFDIDRGELCRHDLGGRRSPMLLGAEGERYEQ
jgi:hypothetical protein